MPIQMSSRFYACSRPFHLGPCSARRRRAWNLGMQVVSLPHGMPAVGNQPDLCRSPASSGVRRGDRADQLGRECVLRIGRRVVHHFNVA